MSDQHELCRRFEDQLLEDTERDRAADTWREHLDECQRCSEQLAAHTLLSAAFETEPVPELSPSFDGRLAARVDARVQVKRLRGWRLVAMAAYVTAAAAGLAWAMRDVPMPAIDPSSAWTAVIACALVPPSLALALLVSRLLPIRAGEAPNGRVLLGL